MDEKTMSLLKTAGSENLETLHTQPYFKDVPIKPSTITEGQLEAVALRFCSELDSSSQGMETNAKATIDKNILSIEIAHAFAVDEQSLVHTTTGHNFPRHTVEDFSKRMQPVFVRHIEDILPVSVTDSDVRVNYLKESIIFSFGIRTHVSWTIHYQAEDRF